MNGLSLSKLRAFGATFFIFSDYARPAIRLSALMELPAIFVFTHDAMGDGEDGPTHQPVEHLASLRAIPGLVTLRPGDANEVVEAYRYVMQLRHEPAVLALSRQPLPTLDRSKYAPARRCGARRLRARRRAGRQARGDPDRHRAARSASRCEAHEKLRRRGHPLARGLDAVVGHLRAPDAGVPRQRAAAAVKARVAIEQASTFGWERYVGDAGRVIGMKTFGASAPLKELQKKFGFEPDRGGRGGEGTVGQGVVQ